MQTSILGSYIAMIRKAEYHAHPPPARAAGGGGGAATTAADTATVMFAVCLTRGVRSKATVSPVCRVLAQADFKLLQNGDIRYHTESDPSNAGLPCASYYLRAAHVLRYTTTLPAAVASALATAAAVNYTTTTAAVFAARSYDDGSCCCLLLRSNYSVFFS